MSLLSRDEAPSKSSIRSALSPAGKLWNSKKKSGDETIVLSSHFVLERGKKEIIQRRVEAFKGLAF